MYTRLRERYQAIMAVGRQFTHLVRKRGSIAAGLEELKRIGRAEQQAIINGLERAFTDETTVDDADLQKTIGPYGVLQRLILTVKKEGGDPVAVFPYFDRMLMAINEQTRALWVSISGFLVYMVFVLFVAALIFTILLIFVIPQFRAMFDSFGADLPALTNMITRNNATIFYGILICFALLIFGLLVTVLHVFDVSGRLLPLSRALRHAPFLNNVTLTYNRLLALNYARLFVAAGLPDDQALTLSAQMASDESLQKITSGEPQNTKRWGQVLAAIAIAKDAENLEAELDYHINDQNYQLASDFTNARQKSLFVLHGLLAVFVGTFVIAMYLPIFKMGEVG